jgi:hypothetical protein
MDRFRVTAYLKTPIIFGGGYATLDGLLGALLFDKLEDVDAAHAAIPLENTGGLFHASSAIYEPIEIGRTTFVASLRAQHDLDADLLRKNKTGTATHRAISTKRERDFGNVFNTYRRVFAPTIDGYAEGDATAVQNLLDGVCFIGKRRASGYGEVERWAVEPDELDGIIGHLDEPLRPVPVEMFLGDRTSIKADAAWRPAYWNPAHRAICFVPWGAQ